MKFRTPDGMSVEIIDLSMTSSGTDRLTEVSDGLWLILRNRNLTDAGRAKLPPIVAGLWRAQDPGQPVSPAITAWLDMALLRFGIEQADLAVALRCRPFPSSCGPPTGWRRASTGPSILTAPGT